MGSFIYNPKFYTNWIVNRAICLSRLAVNFRDSFIDKRICGVSLTKYAKSVNKGSTGSQSTPYLVLEDVFKGAEFKPSDSFIDVGCGRGRVLAYMVREKYPCKINGVELNQDVASFAQNWAKKYSQVNVICADAFSVDYNNYSIIYMGRPFEPELFYKFINYLESNLTHPVKLYYWVEQQSGPYLDGRKGWRRLKRKRLFWRKGYFIANTPQRYSIWTFTPQINNSDL